MHHDGNGCLLQHAIIVRREKQSNNLQFVNHRVDFRESQTIMAAVNMIQLIDPQSELLRV